MAERLRQAGQRVVTVEAGRNFRRIGESAYVVNPDRAEDYQSLLREIGKGEGQPQRITHLWGVTSNANTLTQAERFEVARQLGFQSLIYLAQALGRQVFTEKIKLDVVTSNMQDVTGEEELRPEKAIAVGPCKVIPQEYPNVICRSIDVTISELTAIERERLADQVLKEIVSPSTDLIVAHRGNHRSIQIFESGQSCAARTRQPHLRPQGVYLITGGLGQIGLTLAQYLAATLQARLVLTGRSRFPASAAWDQWLASHDESDEVSRKIRALQSIEKLGGEVITMQADVADYGQMLEVIANTMARYGSLHGVIHAAGVIGKESMCPVQSTGQAEFERNIRPKVEGTYVLEQVLRGQKLDFCMLVSSLASVLGGLGFAAYSAANLFMDAFACEQNRTGTTPWMSVNWDGWRFDKEQSVPVVGMPAELGLTPQEGVEVFQSLLSLEKVNQVVISTGDLHARINQWVRLETLRDDNKAGLSRQARPEGASGAVAPRSQMEESLVRVWEELLGVEPIGVEDNFFELGGHSLLVIQVMSRIRDLYRVELPIGAIFDAPTIAQLARHIEVATENGNLEVPKAVEAYDRERVLPLSYGQQRLWFLDRLAPGSLKFNITSALRLSGPLNISALSDSLSEIYRRHQVLRTCFPSLEGSPRQLISPHRLALLPLADLSALQPSHREAAARAPRPPTRRYLLRPGRRPTSQGRPAAPRQPSARGAARHAPHNQRRVEHRSARQRGDGALRRDEPRSRLPAR